MTADPKTEDGLFGPFTPITVTPYFSLEKADSLVSGRNQPYYRLTERDSVICCVLDQNDNFIMVRQYRPNLESITLEVPAGAIEPGELPLNAARQELSEEVGLACPMLALGHHFRLMMNRSTSKDFLFFGMLPTPLVSMVVEPGIERVRVARLSLLSAALTGQYQQLAGLGLLNLVGAILSVDIWRDPLEKIERAFRSNNSVVW